MAAKKKQTPRKKTAAPTKARGGKAAKRSEKAAQPTAPAVEPISEVQVAADQPRSGRPEFAVVGLGASAGGLEALEEFFQAMPGNSGMAFVVVMHQSAQHVSLLPNLLAKCTPMEVLAIREGVTVQPNTVYIVPPGKNVDLFGKKLALTDILTRHMAPLPIDYFFRSLAQNCQEMAVAIVLSGTGSDGATGLSAIKGESGMVMVQSVESAKFSGMPQSAIAAGLADFVLSPRNMPEQLLTYARGPFLKAPHLITKPQTAIQQSLREILLHLRRQCGHDFSGYKTSTVCRRIERRMNVHQITEPQKYLRFLREHEPECKTLFKELLIGVTSFFRDPWTFETLTKQVLLPLLEQKNSKGTFRVWVAGCSTGEEAYTLAILLRECLDRLQAEVDVQIFATDLDADAIEMARKGLFPSGIGTDVSAARLKQYFTTVGDHYRIRKDLRDWLVFAPQNVIHDPPFTKLDLVSCRNLLIYLQPELQEKLLKLFHYSLSPGGALLLGTSESIGDFSNGFDVVDQKAKLFRRQAGAPRLEPQVEFPLVDAQAEPREKWKTNVPKKSSSAPLPNAVAEMLVNCFAPPTVVVDQQGEILHVHGRTGQFLELAPGGQPKNIVTMAREGLELELATALRLATSQDEPVVRPRLPVRTNGDTLPVTLTVQRIGNPVALRGMLRVTFELQEPQLALEDDTANSPETKPSKRRSVREQELERELQHNRESLQRSIEELDASNEEMKSTNEELQSTNEELQSTNEELETSKEELQSLNEELQTINDEYQGKIQDLSRVNDDMSNLLNSTNIATVFLDNRLCIKRYTDGATAIIHLIPTDLGRPLRDLKSTLEYEHLVDDAQEVLKTLLFKEREVRTQEGCWLLMRILPYRTSEDKIMGLVVTFLDINDVKQAQLQAQRDRDYADNIIATVREPLLVLDDQLQIKSANRAFYRTFAVEEKAVLGKLIYDLGKGQWDIPALRELLDQLRAEQISFDDFEVVHDFPKIGKKRFLLNARHIHTDDDLPGLTLLAMEEMRP